MSRPRTPPIKTHTPFQHSFTGQRLAAEPQAGASAVVEGREGSGEKSGKEHQMRHLQLHPAFDFPKKSLCWCYTRHCWVRIIGLL